ncbi:methyl-accepting chemotaxis protein [Bradyrhizobium canariense]|uniref:methyl-accepting chemotaxis protein n=1 Tax=Bradyrhizobium canariense TaxID=255045 RepID=UPI000A198614|nr:methyl-accepting chemotaxis protein [Bradyrhizobium canariense]OSI28070.1 hypothetical protein BST66_30050 [Bradyrhizobium canariense]
MEKPRGDCGLDWPQTAAASELLPITRRHVLGGLAASPALVYGTALGAENISWYDLRFTLSRDSNDLTVVEVAMEAIQSATDSKAKSPKPVEPSYRPVSSRSWTASLSSFGPSAWFDMAQPTTATIDRTHSSARKVIVRNASFGGRDNVDVSFIFDRAKNPHGPGYWRIAYETELWRDARGAPLKSDAIFLKDFMQGASLSAKLAAAQVGQSIDRIFASRLQPTNPNLGNFEIELDATLEWKLRSIKQTSLVAFDRQIEIDSIVFGWKLYTGEKRSSFSATAPVEWPSKLATARLRIGAAAGHHVVVAATPPTPAATSAASQAAPPSPPQPVPPTPQATLELRRGAWSADPRQIQTTVALRVPQAEFSVMEGARVVSGPVRFVDAVITETGLQGLDKRIRRVVWGNAVGGGPGDILDADVAAHSQSAGAASATSSEAQREIASPVGRIRIGPPRPEIVAASKADQGAKVGRAEDAAAAAKNPPAAANPSPPANGSGQPSSADQERAAAARFLQAASGDQGGAREATLFVVHDEGRVASAGLRRLAVELSLFEISTALPDASFSRLTFESGDLRLIYDDGKAVEGLAAGEYPRRPASSFIWLGPAADSSATIAQFDLSRATLTCARDYDLAKVRLRFHDLVLSIGARPTVRPAHADCRVIHHSGGAIEDNRPILVAEFDPQHVFEETLFRPEPPPLPDVALEKWPDSLCGKDPKPAYCALEPSREAIIDQLTTLSTDERVAFRSKIRAAKEAQENSGRAPSSVFREFAKAFESAAANLPGIAKDQIEYIGPFALDPDVMALARMVQRDARNDGIISAINEMLARIAALIANAATEGSPLKGQLLPVNADRRLVDPKRTLFQNALRNEAVLERQDALYGVFRDFWRDSLVIARTGNGKVGNDQVALTATELADQRLDEFLSPGNRPADDQNNPLDYRAEIVASVKKAFLERVLGRDEIKSPMAARLSGTSRLAFRINCQAIVGLDAEEAGLPQVSPAGPGNPGPGVVRYRPLPFTFEALTDWSRHEPAVTRRALKLFEPLASGLMPPLGNLAANESDQAVLRLQGFSEGPTTAARRMSEVRDSLRRGPSEFETAIEIPSRLLLSTAQTAIWLANRRLPSEVLGKANGAEPIAPDPATPLGLESGRDPAPLGRPEVIPPHRLWSVRLSVGDAKPELRVIGSPDLRLMALGGYAPGDPVRLPGHGAPRRGPYAPWFLGLEQMESGTLDAGDVNDLLADGLKVQGTVCPQPVPVPDRRPRLIRWLCERAGWRQALPGANYAVFRSSLDAFDRHQLVLLSSAYGLPVNGKRQQVGDDVEFGGGLVQNSGQFEPGEAFALLDGRDDQAIYRPIPLNVRELTLTALGGSFLHDTSFKPAAGADDVFGRKIFDGFSIERWEHHMVLGRDIRVQVVYKGYLFPFGHRASMIKLTERIFLRTKKEGIKALLRQRLYLEIANPLKRYPAVGQPHGGRLWCGKDVRLLTTRTPDLIDPTLDIGKPDAKRRENLNGRIDLGRSNPGLAFWPRLDITPAGRFRFDLAVDQASTTLPLIFVDNIAATNKGSLEALAGYYNDAAQVDPALRTMAFGGQKIQYCEEQKTGDATFRTDRILVRAHGRLSPEDEGWTGKLDNYQTTGVLEGAEQPPFYPAMRRASIRIDQATRLSGGKDFPVDAQYDGHYVRFGFPAEPAAQDAKPQTASGPATPPYANALGIFLDLLAAVKLDMGSNGDRSAAVARPHMNMIALSRKKGPLGGDGTLTWRSGPDSDVDRPQEVSAPFDDFAKAETLVSLVNYFNAESRTVPVATPADRRAPATVPAPPDRNNPPGIGPQDPQQIAKMLEVVKSYFSADAKLLGTITLKQLMVLLDVDISRLPVLQEAIEYGTAALSSAEGAARDLANDVRTRVLAPLRAVIERMRREWTALDASLLKRQSEATGDAVTPLHLVSLYPEIDKGLTNVKASLDMAIATEDAIALPPQLAAVYEAGRDLIHSLAVLASNPVQRLEQAVGGEIQRSIEKLRTDAQLKQFADRLKFVVDRLKDAQPADVAARIVAWIGTTDDGGPAARLTFALIPPDLLAITDAIQQTVPPAIRVELEKIQSELVTNTTFKAAPALQSLLTALIATIITKGSLADLDDTLKASLKALVTDIDIQLRGAVDIAQARIAQLAGAQLDVLKNAMTSELKAFIEFVGLRIKKAIDGTIDLVEESYPAELAFAVESAQIISRAIVRVQKVRAALDSGNPRTVLAEASDLVQDIYGVDLAGEVKTAVDGIFDQIKANIGGWAQQLGTAIDLDKIDAAALSAEVAACQAFRSGQPGAIPARDAANKIISSVPLTDQIANAIEQLPNAVKKLVEINQAIDAKASDINNAGLAAGELREFTTATIDLIQGGLLPELRVLYCESVDLVVAIRATAAALNGVIIRDAETLGQITRASDAVRTNVRDIAASLKRIIERIAIFASNHQKIIAKGLLLGGGAAVVADSIDSLRPQFGKLAAEASEFETKTLTPALRRTVNVALGLVRSTAAGGKDGTALVRGAVERAIQAIGKLGVSLEPEAGALVKSIGALEQELATLAKISDVDVSVTKIDALLKSPMGDGTVQSFFGTAPEDKLFRAVADRTRDLELRIVAKSRALYQRLQGWQSELRSKVEPLILGTGLLGVLAEGYDEILEARNAAVTFLDGTGALKTTARRVLLVRPVDGSECKIDDPREKIDKLIGCDELHREADIVGQLRHVMEHLPASTPAEQKRRDDLIQLLRMWKAGTAAPIVILTGAADLVTDVLRGDILAAIDFGAFRDQIEDAIAELIPTRATLNYDFRSSINRRSSQEAIFQPAEHAPFGIEVRASADLLKGTLAFAARGYLGRFDIKLIGSIVDALTLKFGGASFTLEAGAKPRFDVIYEDFIIGRDLEFAQKLQSYLKPDEGSGVFIQPLVGRPGLEAGYGINLGVLSVGATSFFNVTLNVSAELPFNNGESLFKVSLGRRLAPFTMSALPFAGSGYFSIFAGADGIRGFEASFEFGAGGSIGYGVLSAQVRIQVGVFVRVLKVDNDNITELYGTFFAGGSASIWIFHFATSLYVRLGQASGGAMYGEAVYSFSFSLGLADYDYSVTAHHQENAVGSQKTSALLDDVPGGVASPIRFAAAAAAVSDAPPIGAGLARGHRSEPVTQSLAADPLENWAAYRDYFDASLLPDCVFP